MKTYKKIALVLSVSGMATSAWAADSLMSSNQPMMMLTSQQFVNDAAAGGMKEVQLSEIALNKSQNPAVKHFAHRMIRDHSKADEKLLKIAENEGLSVPQTNMYSMDDPNWQNQLLTDAGSLKGAQLLTMTNLPYMSNYQAIQRLKGLNGEKFDQSYTCEMITDHTNAIQEFTAASQNLSDEKLKNFAEKTLPTLREHYSMIMDVANKVGVVTMVTNNTASTGFVPTSAVSNVGL